MKTATAAPKASAKTAAPRAKASPPAGKAKPAPTPKPAAKPVAKAASKPAAKPVAKPAAKPVAKSAAKPVAKPAPEPAKAKVASGAKPLAKTVSKSAKSAAAAAPRVPDAAKLLPGDSIVVQPAGKRATKKAMLAQMAQAASVPTHAPDAAKATFIQDVSRPIMTPTISTPARKDPKRANNWKTKGLDALVDEDMLAMSDTEYMNEVQLAFFRRKLEQLKNDMLANAGETTEHLREDTVVVPDPADRATIEEEHALELRTRDRERKLLKKIEQAIARIDAGDYGYCDETGEPIGVGRLLARPTASLSIEAQQRRELKQKLFGD